MAADPNMGVQHGMVLPTLYNCHTLSFQSGAINSSVEMIPGFISSSGGINTASGMTLGGIPSRINNTSAVIPVGSTAVNLLLDPVPEIKHDTELAVDWSFEEQSILADGLLKFADESNIMRYIKIAALLPDKSVRDVVLRCRWMSKKENGKRHKPEGYYTGKKMDRKGKLVDSSSNANVPLAQPTNMAAYSFVTYQMDKNNCMAFEVPAIDAATGHILDENYQLFSQIAANLETFKLQDNINLFSQMWNNLTAINNGMDTMPGIMSQMPPLPVSVNEDLFNTVLTGTTQAMRFGRSGGIHLKQECRGQQPAGLRGCQFS